MSYLIPTMVRRAAEEHADDLAVVDERGETTYRELLRQADAVAGALQRLGMRPGQRVGILAAKSARCVAAMLGTLQAAGCYVPVDPRAPAARVGFILQDAGIAFLITEASRITEASWTTGASSITEASLPHEAALEPGRDGVPAAGRILLLDDAAEDAGRAALSWSDVFSEHSGIGSEHSGIGPPQRNENDPAYILYTSGSTGRPKGVVVSHRNALTFVSWAKQTFEIGLGDRLSNHAPFHFDLSVFDLYGALSSGASVHLVPDRLAPFPVELARWIDEERITVWYSVPSALVRLLLRGELSRFAFDHLRAVLFAGEVFPVKHLREVMKAFPGADFHNLYGPTETNVCTHHPVPRPLPDDLDDIPIGRPCANVDAFALRDSGERCGVGEEGELVVRGPCVMLGYWGRPERTAGSIGQNPLHTDFNDPVYRTGDRVRVLEDGSFQFLGRRDHMVKVRGYRVELGEIEQALHTRADIREAVVVAVEDDELGARLHAVVVGNGGTGVERVDVLRHCSERLPRYAVPERVHLLDDLPRTSTGKVDRILLKRRLMSALRFPTTEGA